MGTAPLDEAVFQCSRCGAVHDLPTFAWDYPMPVLYVPSGERAGRVRLSSDTCVIDHRRFFIRGCVIIPVHGRSEPFIWGVWAEVSASDFERHANSPDASPPFAGRLPSVPPVYPDSEPAVEVQPRPGERPWFRVKPDDHPIAVQQRNGISVEELRRIAEETLHPSRHTG